MLLVSCGLKLLKQCLGQAYSMHNLRLNSILLPALTCYNTFCFNQYLLEFTRLYLRAGFVLPSVAKFSYTSSEEMVGSLKEKVQLITVKFNYRTSINDKVLWKTF